MFGVTRSQAHRASFYSFFFFFHPLSTYFAQNFQTKQPSRKQRRMLAGLLLFQGNHMAALGTETDSEDGTVVQNQRETRRRSGDGFI